MKTRTWLPYAVGISASLVTGFVGSVFTFQNIPSWYDQLSRPFWTPPNWVFGPVWTTLYILMGISAALVWNSSKKGKWLPLSIFVLQLLVNAGWSIVFFGMHDVAAALLVIKALWLLIIALMLMFWRYSRTATYLLIPYLLWVTYASTLNLGIILLNPSL